MENKKKALLIILGIVIALIVGILIYVGNKQRLELQLQTAKTDVRRVISNINNYCTIEDIKYQQGVIPTKSICVDSKTIKENIDKITDIGSLDSILLLSYSDNEIKVLQAKYKEYKLIYSNSWSDMDVFKLSNGELKQIENGTYGTRNPNEMDEENTSNDNINNDENNENINDDNTSDDEVVVTPTYPIYEPNSKVQEVIDQFILNYDHRWHYYIDIYINEELSGFHKHNLALYQVNDLIMDDQKCNKEKYSKPEQELDYGCRYLKYDDFNSKYKSMFGSDATKDHFNLPTGCTEFTYDKENNVYRILSAGCGGDYPLSKHSEVIDSKEEGNYLYIYEKVAYISFYDGGTILYPHDSENKIELNNKYNEGDYVSIKNDHLDDFDTYKWTFKKNNNGDYTFQKLEYVK